MIAFNTNQMEVHQNLKTSNPIKANVLGIASTSCLYHVYGSMNASISLLDPTGKHDRNDFVLLKECGNLVFHDYDKLRDKEISYAGLNGSGPFIFAKESDLDENGEPVQRGCKKNGYGCILFQTRKSNLQYVVINTEGYDSDRYIVAHIDVVEKLLRYFTSQNELVTMSLLVDRPPLLRDGFMDDIIKNSIEFIQNHDKFAKYGTRPSRGLIFRGDPGNGKTMTCKWLQVLAKRAGLSVSTINSSTLDYYQKNNMLTNAMNKTNIIFFDDIDITYLTRRKGNRLSDSHMACSLLSAMDGISDFKCSVVRIFTTNETIFDIDPAFLRPGRIDKVMSFDPPEAELRRRYITDYWHNDIKNGINTELLVKESHNLSFAELEEIKTLLVQDLIHNGTMNLNTALKSFKARQSSEREIRKMIAKSKEKVEE